MYPLSPNGDLDAAYLLYWLISEPFAGFTVEHEGRTVLPKINQQGLNQTPVPLAPLPDQLETVRRLRTAFDWIDRLAYQATSARKLIDRLDQSVLAKAFRGELVPQDPEDEPASVLLDRIKAERGAMPKAMRGRKARA
jgi:type I restriction enzyme S subunit